MRAYAEERSDSTGHYIMSRGRLLDTYAAALQNELVDLPADTLRVGVVRRPTPWLWSVIDENRRALGPPDTLLTAFRERVDTLTDRGIDEVAAHNRAMVDERYASRYRRHLDRSEDARAAIEDIRRTLQSGQHVALVCFENTEEKGCHRTILRERIAD